MAKLVNYFKECVVEMKKVTWPTRHEATNHTLLVIGISVAVAVFIGFVDYALTYGLGFLVK